MSTTKHDRDPELVRRERRERRGERGGAGGDRDRDGEDVVGEQRDAGDLRRQQAEVVAGDDVGAAGGRVGLDRLPVREDQEPSTTSSAIVIGTTSAERGDADGRHEDAEDLLGRVGRRREVVGREHRERGRLAEPLVLEPLGVQRRTEQLVLDPVAAALGERDARGGISSDRRNVVRCGAALFDLHDHS